MANRIHPSAVKLSTDPGRVRGPNSPSKPQCETTPSLKTQRSQLRATRRQLRQQVRALRSELTTRKRRRDEIKSDVHALRDQLHSQQQQARVSEDKLRETFEEAKISVRREFQQLEPKCEDSAVAVEKVSQRIIQTLQQAVDAVGEVVEKGASQSVPKETKPPSQRTEKALGSQSPSRLDDAADSSPLLSGQALETSEEWLTKELAQLTDLTNLTKDQISQLEAKLRKPVQTTISSAETCKKIQGKVAQTTSQLKAARRELHSENQSIARIENDITCIEARIALLDAQIQCIEFIIQSMEREAEEAEKAFREREEQLLIKEAEEKAQRAAQLKKQDNLRLQSLSDELKRREHEYQQARKYSHKSESKDDLQSIQNSIEETKEALRLVSEQQQAEKDVSELRREAQNRAECQLESAISFLSTLLGSGKDACSTTSSLPAGVRMSGSVLVALDELDDLARCNASENFQEQNQTSKVARLEIVEALKQGTVPEPIHFFSLAKDASAPQEWLNDLKSWSGQLKDLHREGPKNGQLKGVVEQKKLSVMANFVTFLETIGGSNIRAMLTGEALDYTKVKFSEQSSSNMNQILDNLFAQ